MGDPSVAKGKIWDEEKLNLLVPNTRFEDWTEEQFIKHARWLTMEEADDFFHVYSMARGFVYRKRDSKSSKLKQDAYRRWCCTKEGVRDLERAENLVRKREEKKITRELCQHYVTISWKPQEQCYRALHFKPEHNHYVLTTKETLTLPSNNRISEGQKQQIRDLNRAGVRPKKILGFMANQAGGYNWLNFRPRNLYNFLYTDMKTGIKDGDAETMLCYLVSKVINGDKNLFCKYTVDDDGKLCHLFWADSKMREDYHKFCELIAFDATYKTNDYLLPWLYLWGSIITLQLFSSVAAL